MKLYLSSYHLGDNPQQLKNLVGANKKVAVIPNALDYSKDLDRKKESIQRNFEELAGLGLIPEELDLRNYFGKTNELRQKLKQFGLIWARGGNCFVLLKAMVQSGFVEIIKEYRGKDELVYGGYSAGVCVLSPTLRGFELVDDAKVVPPGYENQTIWNGIGLLDYSIVPHYQSDHPEAEAVNDTITYMIDHKLPFKTLKDGQVIVEEV